MLTPRYYQLSAIEHIIDHNTYLCDDCGLGKTLVAVEAVLGFGPEKKNLVICRKTARPQWRDTILSQMPDAEVIFTNHYKYKFDEIDAWFITTMDELVPRSLLYPAATTVWNTIIIDEAHRLKNHATARSKNITHLVGGRKIAISATPVEKHGGELWPILKWLAPDQFPTYWTWVSKMFKVRPGHFGGFDIGDPKNLIDYQAAVMPYVIRRTKEMVAPELPEKVLIDVPIQMTVGQQEIYDNIKQAKDVLVKIEDTELLITNALSLFTKLHEVAVLPSLVGADYNSAKMLWLEDFLEDTNFQVVVFTRYRGVVEAVRRELEQYGVFTVMKGVDESERFKAGYGRVLVGTIDAMSESLSLECATAAVFLDQHWSATQMQQAMDRIHRMNITDRKFIYFLLACEEDYRVMDVINKKYDDQEMLLRFAKGE